MYERDTLFNLQSLSYTVMSASALGVDEVIQMDLDELKRTNKNIELDADDLSFPAMAHHMTVRGKLEALVEKDVISYDEMSAVYEEWKESKQ